MNPKIWIVYGVYYEEDHYQCESVVGIYQTLDGATKDLAEMSKNKNYEEYKIEKSYLRP
jgi:hypothetical protein